MTYTLTSDLGVDDQPANHRVWRSRAARPGRYGHRDSRRRRPGRAPPSPSESRRNRAGPGQPRESGAAAPVRRTANGRHRDSPDQGPEAHSLDRRDHGQRAVRPPKTTRRSGFTGLRRRRGSASCGVRPATDAAGRARRRSRALARCRHVSAARDDCPRRRAAIRRGRDRPRAPSVNRSAPSVSARVSHGRSTSADGDVAQACCTSRSKLGLELVRPKRPSQQDGDRQQRRLPHVGGAWRRQQVLRQPPEHVLGDRDLAGRASARRDRRRAGDAGPRQSRRGTPPAPAAVGEAARSPTSCRAARPGRQPPASTVDSRSPATNSDTRASCGMRVVEQPERSDLGKEPDG